MCIHVPVHALNVALCQVGDAERGVHVDSDCGEGKRFSINLGS